MEKAKIMLTKYLVGISILSRGQVISEMTQPVKNNKGVSNWENDKVAVNSGGNNKADKLVKLWHDCTSSCTSLRPRRTRC